MTTITHFVRIGNHIINVEDIISVSSMVMQEPETIKNVDGEEETRINIKHAVFIFYGTIPTGLTYSFSDALNAESFYKSVWDAIMRYDTNEEKYRKLEADYMRNITDFNESTGEND